MYDISSSRLTHRGPLHPETDAPAPTQAEAAPAEEKKQVTRAMLFVSATCPNCKLAKSLLQKDGFVYKEVLASENVDLANQYGVKQAPTLVVTQGEEFVKYKGVSEIKGMLTARAKEAEKQAM